MSQCDIAAFRLSIPFQYGFRVCAHVKRVEGVCNCLATVADRLCDRCSLFRRYAEFHQLGLDFAGVAANHFQYRIFLLLGEQIRLQRFTYLAVGCGNLRGRRACIHVQIHFEIQILKRVHIDAVGYEFLIEMANHITYTAEQAIEHLKCAFRD